MKSKQDIIDHLETRYTKIQCEDNNKDLEDFIFDLKTDYRYSYVGNHTKYLFQQLIKNLYVSKHSSYLAAQLSQF